VFLQLIGCADRSSNLRITSYADPFFPDTYRVTFDRAAWRIDGDGDYHFAAIATQPAEDPRRSPIEQLLHVHMFWKPWPGKTPDNPTGADALVRYAIVSDSGTEMYRGTAFVYVRRRPFRRQCAVQIEGGQMHRVGTGGSALLGDSRIKGRLYADDNPGLVVEVARRLDLIFGSEAENP